MRELIPFVSRPMQRYALAKAALHDGSAGRIDGFDSSHSSAGDGNTGRTRKNEYQRKNKGEGGVDPLRESVEIPDVLSHQQMVAIWKGLKPRAQHRSVHRFRLPCALAEAPEDLCSLLGPAWDALNN